MATPTQTPPPTGEEDRSVGELVLDVSERVSILVREEIELAKAEVGAKVKELVKGSVVGVAAGVFVLGGLFVLMHAIAWGINDILGVSSSIWAGFLVEAFALFGMAAVSGFLAYKFVQKGGSPTPEMAIEEAKVTKDALGGKS